MEWADNARQWWRENREQAAERKAQKRLAAINDPHGHSRFWLLNVPATATICAAFVEWYWALLFCVEATGAVDWNWATAISSTTQPQGAWDFSFSAHLPVLIGLLAATAPIVMLSMVWLPVQFALRGAGRWRRGTIIIVGLLANLLVIISGTIVMNYNRQDQVREALVVEQSADANRAMLTASVEDLRAELDTLMNHRSAYVATAASVGLAAYQANYASDAAIAAERDPARRGLLTRARGAAARADELRAQITAARQQVAQAAPVAASQANVQDNVGVGLNTFAQYAEVYRPPFIAIICTLIGIFGTWWVIAMLERMNPRDVLRSGWADDAHRIEDKREEEAIAAQPMKPPREVIHDAETGDELVKVRPHWRKLKKGRPQQVQVTPEPQPDESGVTVDGGGRIGTARDVPTEIPNHPGETDQEAKPQTDEEIQDTPPEDLTDEELLTLSSAEADSPAEDEAEEVAETAEGEQPEPDHEEPPEPRDEPEDRPERMIA